ncbi:alpha-amylase [Marinilabiliaceae bacterium JC017]|nr:alpha-amylase [Marinilabiliaceae bacterium JC017]
MKNLLNLFTLSLLIALFGACQVKTTRETTLERELKRSETPVPEWSKNAVIYEVNVRQYTEAGTFKAFEAHLPRLKELGVDILWFMPIHPIGEENRKGTLGSYYSVKNYKAVNPEFGTMDDFKQLVAKCHQMGFKVLIDWVANHTAWDNAWMTNHPEWYAKDSTDNFYGPFDWSDVAQLDYDNQEMRAAMTDALKFWVQECNIDGYRCDVAGMVPVDFWENTRTSLETIKPVYMLAEDEEKKELLNKAFNANYGWSFHHLLNEIAKEEEPASEIPAYYAALDTLYPQGVYPMQFTSNHDENSWNSTAIERLGDGTKTFAALTFTVPGLPLIYTGQEAGLNKRLEFFEKDQVDWTDLSLTPLYQHLATLKEDNKALWNGTAGGDIEFMTTNAPENALCFQREKDGNEVIAIFNLSNKSVSLSGADKLKGTYKDYFTHRTVTFPLRGELMQPWEFVICLKE